MNEHGYLIHYAEGGESNNHTYTDRKWVNGRWQYTYPDDIGDRKEHMSSRLPVGGQGLSGSKKFKANTVTGNQGTHDISRDVSQGRGDVAYTKEPRKTVNYTVNRGTSNVTSTSELKKTWGVRTKNRKSN